MTNFNKKISIIMAMYNSNETIIKALDSFVPFMDNGMELIIVDDCSKDSSYDIVKKYIESKKNRNITLLKNDENLGAGLSRNKALKIASGEYVGFIDSDDYVDKNYYKKMLDIASENKSDIVVSDITLVDNEEHYSSIYANNIYDNVETDKVLISKELLFGYWGCVSTCSKIFKRELIKDCKFSKSNHDDLLFTIPAIIKSETISYCKGNQYYYYQSQKSLTRNHSFKKYRDGVNTLFEAVNYLLNQDKECAKIYSVNSLLPFIAYSLNDESRELDTDLLKIIKENIDNYKINVTDLISNNKYLPNSKMYTNYKYKRILKNLELGEYDEIINILFKPVHAKSSFSNFINLLKTNPNKIFKKNMPDFNPLVSIVIPVYNGENYLREAIESALSQTYKNIEIIVVDDGSKDKTEEIAKSFGNKIRYFKKENGGAATALCYGIDKMKGEYFSWLSHDDLYFPYKIEKEVDFLKYQVDKNVVLFADYMLVNEDGYPIGEPVRINHNLVMKKKEYCLLRGSLNGITMLIPREAFDKCGKFDSRYRCTQDYDMWIRLLKQYKFIHIPEVLAKTRIHSNQDTNTSPVANSEGDELWTRMINDLSDDRKKELEGSLFNFYYKMANHLIYSPYKKTIDYCINECKKIDEEKYNKHPLLDVCGHPVFKKKNLFEKIVYCLKTRGLKETFTIIINKLRRK